MQTRHTQAMGAGWRKHMQSTRDWKEKRWEWVRKACIRSPPSILARASVQLAHVCGSCFSIRRGIAGPMDAHEQHDEEIHTHALAQHTRGQGEVKR